LNLVKLEKLLTLVGQKVVELSILEVDTSESESEAASETESEAFFSNTAGEESDTVILSISNTIGVTDNKNLVKEGYLFKIKNVSLKIKYIPIPKVIKINNINIL
jgi:hypothetical protein